MAGRRPLSDRETEMAENEVKNVPPLYGWVIALAAGAVAFGVALVAVGIEGNGSVAIGLVVTVVVGLVFTLAESSPPARKTAADIAAPRAPTAAAPRAASTPASKPAPAAAPTPEPAPPAPPAAAATATAATAAAPVATAPETPAPAVASEAAAEPSGTRPQGLSGPQGTPDDLKKISGVGPVIEGKLHDLGIYHFWQIAAWTDTEVEWVDGFLNFKGRIGRDEWIRQARELAPSSPTG